MFTWLNKQGVKSDKGFVVQSVDRFVIEYREGARIVSVDVERGFLSRTKVCANISSSAFEKWDDGAHIPLEKQKEMHGNFKEAMEFQDVAVMVYL